MTCPICKGKLEDCDCPDRLRPDCPKCGRKMDLYVRWQGKPSLPYVPGKALWHCPNCETLRIWEVRE